ncbi:MAG: serine dehydratase subunit alpha family protein [Bacteroidales bacterium]|nr:serine dehydratase subunit alpha family protein [Bacteroidales bacterium]MBN2747874.1 serine dehydratase subunit alpha family protein [Bacteroidales bacterium]
MGCTTEFCYSKYLKLLHTEVVPALGCTEPIAVALAVAKARETLSARADRVEVYTSPNIYKNGMGVGIPGTGLTGLLVAAALGAIEGDSTDSLELLKNVNAESVKLANELIAASKVAVSVKSTSHKLFVEAICYDSNGNQGKAIIVDKHSNIVSAERNGSIVWKKPEEPVETVASDNPEEKISLTITEIYSFSQEVPFSRIEFILKSAQMNTVIAQEGLTGNYGLKVGKTLAEYVKKGVLSDDMANYAMSLTAAASDARMAGSTLPVMSNSGSGNQGLTATLPVVAVAERLNASPEKLARALVISHLVAIHIKSYLGRLSALCGCVVASAGAGCGISYLMGGGVPEIESTIKNMIGNVTGMICDGAKVGCALKVSSGVNSAVQSALLALQGICISANDGIIEDDVEKTIQNMCRVGAEGMRETDNLLLQIMTSKGEG